ncbi:MAG: N-acetylmuramoyl-L-alanine amidase [Candidatus Binatia bacterium]
MRRLCVSRRTLRIGALVVLSTLATVTLAAAAVVRDVRATVSGAATRVIVEVDGAFVYSTRSGPGGGTVLVDIEDATLGEGASRLVPVSDRRVDGIVVLDDAASRIVRVSVDIAGRNAPRFEATIDGSRLVLSFVDATGKSAATQQGKPGDDGDAPRSKPRDRAASPAPGARTVAAATASAPSAPRQGASRKSVLERPVVVLDPGHGGKDPGAKAWTGEYEKDIVLDLAERVARRLRKNGDVDVVMTRSGDNYIALADRRDTSRRWGAAVFVSIHANASHSKAARGIETYYHPRSSAGAKAQVADREIRRLARVENGGKAARDPSAKGGVARASLSTASPPVLDRRTESIALARHVQAELVRQLGMRYEAVRDLGAKEGPFFVIGDNAAPSVLVEAAFLTHREEGLRMRSEVYREQIADGVSRGILAFLEEQRVEGAL